MNTGDVTTEQAEPGFVSSAVAREAVRSGERRAQLDYVLLEIHWPDNGGVLLKTQNRRGERTHFAYADAQALRAKLDELLDGWLGIGL